MGSHRMFFANCWWRLLKRRSSAWEAPIFAVSDDGFPGEPWYPLQTDGLWLGTFSARADGFHQTAMAKAEELRKGIAAAQLHIHPADTHAHLRRNLQKF